MNDRRQSILITGASRGIGQAAALRLAADGYEVVVNYRQRDAEAQAVIDAIRADGGQARLLRFDVSDRGAAREAIEADVAANGAYYGVVLSAGVSSDGAFPALGEADWDRVIDTNLGGFYNVLHPLIMPMIRRRAPGRIVALTSVSGLMGNRGQVNYSASKAGIIGAAKALAVELAGRKITVNCVAPGPIRTEMIDGAPLEEIVKLIPAKRVGEPEEVAALIAFLCSKDAGYITRQVISVNGGMLG
ncbi:3-oxoacyl-ACP reductase FabG [Abyssibacter sp.]|jgi:3-oxoacyl-[acyl-carrier protein] reductase|uniref:3-oxoacyl-ACP reductase FabG n=1 Tax=Abyssibacter sp. TaxID=2320200 RepID=UPI000C63B20D|nr:3-oxoacyl-ACP reductase FabG [Abyssibacter sp.]MBB86245.1 3-oxoacyl-ACP reductase FabG [Xanthomonadales bacterium]MCK5860565.1 3-oxoacyl-ACP reductase FabG [Abyssibacter sp.]